MWNKDEMKGKADQAKGRIKGTAGEMTDDERLRNEGAADDLKGRAEDTYGKAKRRVGDALDDLGDRIKR
jgi:uncharacterized protein YjbJ (UPF0337 family)